jgi:hypothetical protein
MNQDTLMKRRRRLRFRPAPNWALESGYWITDMTTTRTILIETKDFPFFRICIFGPCRWVLENLAIEDQISFAIHDINVLLALELELPHTVDELRGFFGRYGVSIPQHFG